MAKVPTTILRRMDPGSAPALDDPRIDLVKAWQITGESIVVEHNAEAT